jgi:dihydroneopterin aldolase
MTDTASPADKIFVRDLTFDAILGILPAERITPQPVVINLTLITDTATAAASKNVDDTLNYAELADAARVLTVEGEYLLIETLVEDIAKLCLVAGADAVTVRVEKPEAVSAAAAVGVEIHRERA